MISNRRSENFEILPTPSLGSFDVKREAVALFGFLKAANSPQQLAASTIDFSLGLDTYFLVPVALAHLDNKRTVSELASLRVSANFPADHLITEDSTASWMRNSLIHVPEKILFLVSDSAGTTLGHLGIWLRPSGLFEIDNVIKSPECEVKGLFSEATKAVGNWLYTNLLVERVYLRVDETRSHAIDFYRRIGFGNVGKEEGYDCKPPLFPMAASALEWAEKFRAPSSSGLVLTAGPSIGPYEKRLVADAVDGGWNDHFRDYLDLFTNRASLYLDANYVIPTDSCTSALHLALWSLGIGPGDEVIVPNTTWVATATAVTYVGAIPVFADIEADSWCIDVVSVEKLITSRTKAIMPVHLYGYPANLIALEELCARYGMMLVQDAAPAIGATIDGKSVAQFGDVACFSFQGAKMLVTGEGGLLTTNNPEIYERAIKLASFGRVPDTFWLTSMGKKFAMSNLSAALGAAQFGSIERQIEKKRLINGWYQSVFQDVEGISMQVERPGSRSICWMSSVRWESDSLDVDSVRLSLKERGVDTRHVFPPISSYPIWNTTPASEHLLSELLNKRALNLPSGVNLTRGVVESVAARVLDVLRPSN